MNQEELLALEPGDQVQYTGLDGKTRTMTFKKITGLVQAVKGEDLSPQLQFDYNGASMHVPLNVWELTKVKFTIIKAKND
jgi:hypothetical protein